MAKLYHRRAIPSAFAATDAQAGYPATNLAGVSLAQPWRAADAGAKTIDITIPAATVRGVLLHDVNFTTANIRTSTDGVAFSAATALPTYANRMKRRRGLLALNVANVVKVRIEIAAGAPSDGLAYWRIGHAGIYRDVLSLAVAPSFPYSCPIIQPRSVAQLGNGQRAVANTGPHFQRIELPFAHKETENLDDFLPLVDAGGVALDLELSRWPEQVWPVILNVDEVGHTHPKKRREELQVVLREQV